ncbi:hypothetical protein K443DRAFT_355003 [Laccaria amethystina LaAM-08-1]|uniref:Uncharacterized protein n=1 Tax=Laccaria amethystina LaAM-08-1 TaxID=1095629 RepID=A0A0C9WZZ4_9AGAR|nr:hypothetical protein K443DRAFT_355003 [Laccaria amethystina LaAM-08-1]
MHTADDVSSIKQIYIVAKRTNLLISSHIPIPIAQATDTVLFPASVQAGTTLYVCDSPSLVGLARDPAFLLKVVKRIVKSSCNRLHASRVRYSPHR